MSNIDDIEKEVSDRLHKVVPLNAKVKLDMGTDGLLFLEALGGRAALSRNDGAADCTLKISAANLRRLIAGDLNPLLALSLGRLKVSGNRAVAARLGELLRS
ncbi:MAG: SCP2 sterol-binding domain-containing protein [Kiloniellales bacterium]|nr:SCP2 sterol-binding domain-containing protein [Kiloniellales bacterium]